MWRERAGGEEGDVRRKDDWWWWSKDEDLSLSIYMDRETERIDSLFIQLSRLIIITNASSYVSLIR